MFNMIIVVVVSVQCSICMQYADQYCICNTKVLHLVFVLINIWMQVFVCIIDSHNSVQEEHHYKKKCSNKYSSKLRLNNYLHSLEE